MVYRISSALLTLFPTRVSHLKGRLIRQILAKIITIYSDFGVVISLGRVIRADIRYLIVMDLFFTKSVFKNT